MEEILITQKSQDDSVFPVDDNQSETVEKKQTELLEQKRLEESSQAEPEITRDQLSLSKQLLNWRTLVPLIIVIVAVVFFVQKLHIDPQKTWAAIRSANFIFLLAAFVVYYLSFAIRAARWRILLENVGFTKANGVELPKFWKLTEIIYISWFVNSIVPAKLGDLYRAYLLRQESGVSATRTFGTIMAERLLDLIVLLTFYPSIDHQLACTPADSVARRTGSDAGSRSSRNGGLVYYASIPYADCQIDTRTFSQIFLPIPGRNTWLIQAYTHVDRTDIRRLGLRGFTLLLRGSGAQSYCWRPLTCYHGSLLHSPWRGAVNGRSVNRWWCRAG